MGVLNTFSSTLSLPPVTPGSFTSAGAPSLASLLATPLASLGLSRTTPVVLSSALPLIQEKVVEAIRAGHYVDFKDLLPDNVALRHRMVDTGSWGLQIRISAFARWGMLRHGYIVSWPS